MKVKIEETVTDRFNTSPRLQIVRAAGRFSRSMMSLSNRRLHEAGHDLSLEHAIILKHLTEKEGQSQQQLAENTFKHKTSITFLIDRMVKKNLVVRVPDQTDRRNKLIYLTDKGRNMLNDIFPILFQDLYKITEDIAEQDLLSCIGILEKLLINTQGQLKGASS